MGESNKLEYIVSTNISPNGIRNLGIFVIGSSNPLLEPRSIFEISRDDSIGALPEDFSSGLILADFDDSSEIDICLEGSTPDSYRFVHEDELEDLFNEFCSGRVVVGQFTTSEVPLSFKVFLNRLFGADNSDDHDQLKIGQYL